MVVVAPLNRGQRLAAVRMDPVIGPAMNPQPFVRLEWGKGDSRVADIGRWIRERAEIHLRLDIGHIRTRGRMVIVVFQARDPLPRGRQEARGAIPPAGHGLSWGARRRALSRG